MTNLFLTVLDMSITASYVILAILIMRLLLKKAPKKYSYALWAVAGFRLVCPVSFQSVLSLFNLNLFDTTATAGSDPVSIPENIGLAATPQINVGISSLNTVVNEQLPAATPTASVNPLQIWILVGTVLWLAGIAVMVIVSIINYLRLRHRLRFATRAEEGIWQCETVRSPFILGIVFPTIYLPYGLDDQTLDYILAHEKHHLKRLDHVVKLLSFAVLTVHWFNPLCHLAFYLMNRDMEMSCDEYVLSQNEISSTDYSQTLLSIATNKRFPAPSPLAFGETGVKQRIKNILHWKKPALWVTIVALILTAALLISCAADPKADGLDNTSVPPTPTYEAPFGYRFTGHPVYVSSLLGTTPSSEGWKLDEDRVLSRWDTNQWTNLGQMEPATLTEDNFDIYFISGDKDFIPAELRENNVQAWTLDIEDSNPRFREAYFLLKQTDGSFYIVGGPYQPGKEFASLFVGYLLASYHAPIDSPVATDPSESTAPPETEVFNRGENEQALITQALLAGRNDDLKAGEIGTVSYAVLQQAIACGSSDDPDVPAGYSEYALLVMYQRFTLVNGGIEPVKTNVFPASITVDNYTDGTYSIRALSVTEDEAEPGEHHLALMQGCYANAVAHYGLDTAPIIKDLIAQITASPAQYSGPGPYIEAHQEEYDTLLYYGQHTLTYCFRQLASRSSSGLSGHIMALACQEIIDSMGEEFTCQFGNGTEWFTQFHAHAIALRDQGVDLTRYPASYLLLSILPEPISGAGLSFGMPPAETDNLLRFPGLSWGISLDEALDTLKVDESKYELFEDFLQKRVVFYDADWFGQTAIRAQLVFDYDELVQIYIEYPADADMMAVKSILQAIYGSPADGYTHYRCPLPFETGYKKDDVVPIEYASDDQTVFWVSDVHYNDYLGEEGTADWVYRMRASNTGRTAESFNKVAERNPFSHIVWSTNGTGGYTQLNSQNVVVLACDLFTLSAVD